MAQLPGTVRWRRVPAICIASVLLHYVAVKWALTGLAPPGQQAPVAGPAPVVARLRMTEAQPVPGPVPRAPAREVQRKEPSKAVVSRQAAPAVSAAPAARTGQDYQVSLPPSADLAFALTRVDAHGMARSGEGEIGWNRAGTSYRMHSATRLVRDEILGLAELTSEGEVDQAGIAPRTMTEKRRERARTATHFDREQGRIAFSASQAQAALQAGAQDSVTCLMQLAGIGRAASTQLARGVRMLVAGARDAHEVEFVFAGQEQIETEMGRMAAWKMARPVAAGSYNAYLEIWLAPDHHWYPVQLRSTEANGTVTTQTVRRIVIKEN